MNEASGIKHIDDRKAAAREQSKGLAVAILVFAMMGLCGALATTLIPAVRIVFRVPLAMAMAVQWIALVMSGLSSVPLARALPRLGPARMIMSGLAVVSLGCAMVWQTLTLAEPSFAGLVAALALVALGITALQVSANLLVIELGDPANGAARLTLAQGFNSVGVLAGVNLGAAFTFGSASNANHGSPAALAHGAGQAYCLCAVLVLGALALAVAGHKAMRSGTPPPRHVANATRGALTSGWALAGAAAIALYVGAEGAIGSILIGFLHQTTVLDLSLPAAGRIVANLYWGGALAARFAGSWLLGKAKAHRLLAAAAVLAAAASLITMTASGMVAGAAALSIGVFNAIMFPVIFSITLERATASSAAVSGLLSTATAGGALVSIAGGWVGDMSGMATAFFVPMLAYLAVALFAVAAGRARPDRQHPQELRTTSSVGKRSDLT